MDFFDVFPEFISCRIDGLLPPGGEQPKNIGEKGKIKKEDGP
jgi:hypothetical protein